MSQTRSGNGPPVRRVSSADVASASGVSRTTVSYVLNARTDVRIPEETRSRVLAVAEELGYTPSAAARALRTGRNRLVLLMVPDWAASPGFTRFTCLLTAEMAAQDLTLITHVISPGSERFRRLWSELAPAAVLSFAALDQETLSDMRASGIDVNVALFDRPAAATGEVESPESQIGRTQVAHLIARGHSRLGFTWPTDPALSPFATGRLAGVRAECADRGLPDPVVIEVGEPSSFPGAVEEWRSRHQVTAVCGYNDDFALAVLAAATGAGIVVPDQLAVIGVDDVDAGRLVVPALSTVDYEFDVLARYTATVVAARLEFRPEPSQLAPELAVRLIVRDST